MGSSHHLVARGSAMLARDNNNDGQMSTTVVDLLITLLVLVFVLLCLTATLFTMRKVRQRKAVARQQLPLYNEKSASHRSLTISTRHSRTSSIYKYDEKASLNSPTSPTSPGSVPEIRITFPDEHDASGRPKSGGVVIVRVGETGVGLEPLHNNEQLPAYEKESKGRFQSIDIERIGGLKEKPTYS